ncbi:MAG: aminotransferase class I/II-fold pyridoxal phosphate-dependent enzyme [Coriobacteriales bacterium]|jgi:O-acetylhomoserine (thiol)-lyase|nr:aminotransferase class I/II-fold pyridoxal phosphate-dependent enzyme [Coriobacteriales bacterium]
MKQECPDTTAGLSPDPNPDIAADPVPGPDPEAAAGPAPAYGFDTLKVRAGYDERSHHFSTTVPIYQTVAFGLDSPERARRLFTLEESHPTYSRTANPTVAALEARLAALHGVKGAVALATGMAAVSCALINICGGPGRILSTYQLYGGTLDGFENLYAQLGIQFDAVTDANSPAAFERALTPETKAIFVESITNPLASVLDLEALANIAHAHGIPLIVDNTVATPYLLNPFAFGADIVVYSATKALCGHGNALAGVVLESGSFAYSPRTYPQFSEKLWNLRSAADQERSILDVCPDTPFTSRIRMVLLNSLGATLSPFDAWLILMGIDTLSERVVKQVQNTQAVVAYLRTHPQVAWVGYPTDGPGAELVQKYLPKGAGSILSFGFKGSEAQRRRFLGSVRVFLYQANIGDARSLIIDPELTTHNELSPRMREKMGLTPDTIRLSLGLEDPADLIEDLRQAFAEASQ